MCRVPLSALAVLLVLCVPALAQKPECSIKAPRGASEAELRRLTKVSVKEAEAKAIASVAPDKVNSIVSGDVDVLDGCLAWTFLLRFSNKGGVTEVSVDAGDGKILSSVYEPPKGASGALGAPAAPPDDAAPGAASAPAVGPVFDPAAEEPALRKAVDDEEAAWNGADAKALAALFRDDATYADAFGGVARGRSEVDKRIAEVLSAWRGTRIALKVRKVRVLKPDVALVEADAELTGWKKLPPGFKADADQTLRMRLLQVFLKEAGLWRVAASYEVDVKTKLELPPVPEERSIRGR
ncbi:MAG: SgcJ/EcaC family oxidoreductase [Acidobacteria bacterium]|nr:SgcJ/EcaC family oxidoreductase [Acidobacteriota bacterium]